MGEICAAARDAQFYNAKEEPCKAKHRTMVSNVSRGGKKTSMVGMRSDTSSLPEFPRCSWIRLSIRPQRTKPWEPISKFGSSNGSGNGHEVQLLEEVATDMGLNEANYSTQSIRIGGSTALLNGGANPLVIKLLGQGCQTVISLTQY